MRFARLLELGPHGELTLGGDGAADVEGSADVPGLIAVVGRPGDWVDAVVSSLLASEDDGIGEVVPSRPAVSTRVVYSAVATGSVVNKYGETVRPVVVDASHVCSTQADPDAAAKVFAALCAACSSVVFCVQPAGDQPNSDDEELPLTLLEQPNDSDSCVSRSPTHAQRKRVSSGWQVAEEAQLIRQRKSAAGTFRSFLAGDDPPFDLTMDSTSAFDLTATVRDLNASVQTPRKPARVRIRSGHAPRPCALCKQPCAPQDGAKLFKSGLRCAGCARRTPSTCVAALAQFHALCAEVLRTHAAAGAAPHPVSPPLLLWALPPDFPRDDARCFFEWALADNPAAAAGAARRDVAHLFPHRASAGAADVRRELVGRLRGKRIGELVLPGRLVVSVTKAVLPPLSLGAVAGAGLPWEAVAAEECARLVDDAVRAWQDDTTEHHQEPLWCEVAKVAAQFGPAALPCVAAAPAGVRAAAARKTEASLRRAAPLLASAETAAVARLSGKAAAVQTWAQWTLVLQDTVSSFAGAARSAVSPLPCLPLLPPGPDGLAGVFSMVDAVVRWFVEYTGVFVERRLAEKDEASAAARDARSGLEAELADERKAAAALRAEVARWAERWSTVVEDRERESGGEDARQSMLSAREGLWEERSRGYEERYLDEQRRRLALEDQGRHWERRLASERSTHDAHAAQLREEIDRINKMLETQQHHHGKPPYTSVLPEGPSSPLTSPSVQKVDDPFTSCAPVLSDRSILDSSSRAVFEHQKSRDLLARIDSLAGAGDEPAGDRLGPEGRSEFERMSEKIVRLAAAVAGLSRQRDDLRARLAKASAAGAEPRRHGSPATPMRPSGHGGFGDSSREQGFVGSASGRQGFGSSPGEQSFGNASGRQGFGNATGPPGFGNSPGEQGFGNASGRQGFGNATGGPGFGNSPGERQGFGDSTRGQGFGNSPGERQGFGHSTRVQGFGNSPGIGNSPGRQGFGGSPQGSPHAGKACGKTVSFLFSSGADGSPPRFLDSPFASPSFLDPAAGARPFAESPPGTPSLGHSVPGRGSPNGNTSATLGATYSPGDGASRAVVVSAPRNPPRDTDRDHPLVESSLSSELERVRLAVDGGGVPPPPGAVHQHVSAEDLWSEPVLPPPSADRPDAPPPAAAAAGEVGTLRKGWEQAEEIARELRADLRSTEARLAAATVREAAAAAASRQAAAAAAASAAREQAELRRRTELDAVVEQLEARLRALQAEGRAGAVAAALSDKSDARRRSAALGHALDASTAELKEAREQIETLERALQDEQAERHAEVIVLRNQISARSLDVEAMGSETGSLRSAVQGLRDRLDESQEALSEKTAELAAAKAALKDEKANGSGAESRHAEQIAREKAALHDAQAAVVRLEVLASQQQAELSASLEQQRAVAASKSELSHQVQTLTAELAGKAQAHALQLADARRSLAEAEAVSSSVIAALQRDLEESKKEVDQQKTKRKALAEELKQVEQELAGVRESERATTAELTEVKSQRDMALKDREVDRDAVRDQLGAHMQSHEKYREDIKRQHELVSSERNALQAQLDDCREEMQAMRVQLATYRYELDQLPDREKLHDTLQRETHESSAMADDYRLQASVLEEKLRAAHASRDHRESVHATLKATLEAQNEGLARQITELVSQCESTASENDHLKTAVSELTARQSQILQDESKKRITCELDAARKAERTAEELQQLRRDLAKVTRDKDVFSAKLREVERDSDALAASLKTSKQRETELRAANEELKRAVDSLRDRLRSAEAELSSLRSSATQLQAALAQEQKQHRSVKLLLSKVEIQLNKELAEKRARGPPTDSSSLTTHIARQRDLLAQNKNLLAGFPDQSTSFDSLS
ncbi:hypothetical protein DIPPA_09693 [Diplonema papillatum]|nr:hypothetical protein DIPPA_09693 [Diplonema papillatum]